MDRFSHYRFVQTDEGVELILFLNEAMTEFSNELETKPNAETTTLKEEAINYTKKNLPNLKVKAIKVVAGTLLITSFGFASLTPSAEASTPITQSSQTTYTVVSGDTLSHIANRFGTTVNQIRQANNLNSDFLRVGQTLIIPTQNTTTVQQPTNQNQHYTVVSGDTLSHIANRYGTTVHAIRQANNLNSDFLRIGQTLIIPTQNTTTVQQPTNQNQHYTVVSGDTLSHIANRYGTTVHAIRQANNLNSDFLRIGQTLIIPTQNTTTVQQPTNQNQNHTVVSGDTLSHIANRYGTPVNAIRQANNLNSDFLRIGQVLIIPNGQATTNDTRTQINAEELEWLAKMIFAEARGESLEGQIAVAAVILNRVNNNQFPNTILGVLFEKSHGHYQFSPAGNGALDRATPNAENYEAARRALNGEDPTNGSLFFYNPNRTNDQWVRSRTVSIIIGNHVFTH